MVSRSRATVRAANMSPVPEKKQSNCGISILNRRGLPSDRIVEPTTARVLERTSRLLVELSVVEDGSRSERCTDVTMMCGTCSFLWMTLMASARFEKEVIFTPERSLEI